MNYAGEAGKDGKDGKQFDSSRMELKYVGVQNAMADLARQGLGHRVASRNMKQPGTDLVSGSRNR